MKLFIDTSQPIFFVAWISDDNKCISFVEKETKYKVEEIADFFNSVEDISLIKEIYINIGPGSFTGSRIALLYVRTIIQVFSHIKLFTIDSFSLLSSEGQNKCIYATKNKLYCFDGKQISIVENEGQLTSINFQDVVNNFENYIHKFKLTDIKNVQPLYVGDFQVGEIKK